ncbi:MAG: hypothetical protein GWP91_01420 [Rhodobacterales bacterium]|nr:hypothetical protein [Rhodobacterales bacterium]
MANEVDELFGGGTGTTDPKVNGALVLAALGTLTAIIGMACFSAPGAAIVLVGLWRIEKELDRVDNGYLDISTRPVVLSARRWVFAALAVVIALLFLQVVLYSQGFYQMLGDLFFHNLLAGGV